MILHPFIPCTVSLSVNGVCCIPFILCNTILSTVIGFYVQLFSTIKDSQFQVCVRVFESNSELCTEDNLVEEHKLMSMPPAPRGLPQIEIVFSVDASGISTVYSKIRLFGKLQRITVTSSLSISDRKTDMIIREEDLHIKKDKEIFSDSFLPRQIDWFAEGAVSPIMNQGLCGCCWATSCISAVESLYFIYTGRLIRLSAQQLVDCAVLDGCKGANPHFAYWFMKFHGVCAEKDYPYTSKVQACDISQGKFLVWF
ncbi:heat shock 70 kDa protein 10, mitochondrial-like [Papaver somniferum]|uniref:heat shock 70 kDa protein 10, mitochondrial-like n=1 Tax=Papaver somniferum TaxID=3469 RepID=UPI000E6F90EB|nr:heat shock 70 kDa protein 10, mitochondrial-like [Papaver somniferum]